MNNVFINSHFIGVGKGGINLRENHFKSDTEAALDFLD